MESSKIIVTKFKEKGCWRYKITDQDGCMIWDMKRKTYEMLQQAMLDQIEKEFPWFKGE